MLLHYRDQLPEAVVSRARDVLHQLEEEETSSAAVDITRLINNHPLFSTEIKLTAPEKEKDETLVNAIRALNLDEMTLREALDQLYPLKLLDEKP